MDDLTKPLDEESIKVTMEDFLNALHEIPPAFGASTGDLERCRYTFNFESFILQWCLGYVKLDIELRGSAMFYNLQTEWHSRLRR